MMLCPVCQDLPADQRPLFCQLNRELALRLTCRRLAELVRADEALAADILAALRQEAEAAQQPDPQRLAALKAREETLTRRIKFILSNPGETEADEQEAAAELRRLRGERAQVEAERATQDALMGRPRATPSAAEVTTLLAEMGDVLAVAASGAVPEDQGTARAVVEILTGGRIELTQQGERKAQRGWLRGRFRVSVLQALVGKLTGVTAVESEDAVEVALDYREPTEAEQWAGRVKGLYDRGLLMKTIAAELGINRNLARLALEAWYERAGQALPDGRSRRAQLNQKHLTPPLYQRIAGQVKELESEGLLLQDIAAHLDVDRNTVTKALAYGRGTDGGVPEDGRSRRKRLSRCDGREDRERPGCGPRGCPARGPVDTHGLVEGQGAGD
jgi:hypothetical protein